MQHQKNKKKTSRKRTTKTTASKKEPYGYQPDNPLTIYFKKYIEKQQD
jgi:hypothetical protein|tara:strand:+ start:529 stop:672 length:144 start_codon:yes stop_codon:yes gene_type:complete